MATIPNLLVQGNGKLGNNIHQFSIPAWDTCPGRSAACSACYARSGHFRSPVVLEKHRQNHEATLEDGFSVRMIREVERRWCQVVRIHVAGDFYSAEYAEKWLEVCESCTDTQFYCYTRSWRIPEIADVLECLSSLDNFRLWFSVDDDTGMPTSIPSGVRVAYLQQTGLEEFELVDLVFRVKHLLKTPTRRIGLALVCPRENGTERGKETDCGKCGVCWK